VSDVVTGGDMGGLMVTAVYGDGTVVDEIWYPTADRTGQAGSPTSPYFVLSQSDDTYDSAWALVNFYGPMRSLTLKGNHDSFYPGIVFDLIDYPDDPYSPLFTESTPGSERGKREYSSIYPPPASVAYETNDKVKYQGEDTYDLWSEFKFIFGTDGVSSSYLQVTTTDPFVFYLDTDTVTVVPIPGAYLLMGSGLLCLIAIRRKPLIWR
jgi:hypothetical protein